MMEREKSCGAVLFRGAAGRRTFLVLHSTLGHWTLCKGHVEPGESEHETAEREIREETGLSVGFVDGFRHVITYSPAPGVTKDVVFFLGRAGEDVAVEVLRDGRRLDLGTLHLPYRTLTDESGQQSLKRGVMVGELREAGPLGTLRNAWYQSIDYVRTVWLSLGDLIRGAVSLNDMAGPIGIFAMAGEVGQQGAAAAGMAGALLNIFSFVALIAINLAVMNLLPIPALDGGQILFLLVGGIYHFFTHRRIDQKYLGYINMAGFFCLIALMVVVAVSDVNKLIL